MSAKEKGQRGKGRSGEVEHQRNGETEKRRSERCSSRCGTVISVLLVKWTWKYSRQPTKWQQYQELSCSGRKGKEQLTLTCYILNWPVGRPGGLGSGGGVSGRMNRPRQTEAETDGRSERETDRHKTQRGGRTERRKDGRTVAFNVFRKKFSLRFRCTFSSKGNCRRESQNETKAVMSVFLKIV